MNRISSVSTLTLAAMLAFSTPALAAGKHERAEAAIAEAQAKIDASARIGATTATPRMQADAEAALRTAHEELARGKKVEAIAAAHRASQLADTAMGEAQRAHNENARAATEAARSRAAGAQAQAADAQAEAAAQAERARAAEQAAASAQADAAAARAAPPVVVAAPPAAPAPVTVTTETTRSVAPAHTTAVKHRVVSKAVVHHATPAVTEKTKTTVTTGQ